MIFLKSLPVTSSVTPVLAKVTFPKKLVAKTETKDASDK